MSDDVVQTLATEGYVLKRSVIDREALHTWSEMVNDLLHRAHGNDEALRPFVVYEREIIARQPHRSELAPEDVGNALYLVDDLLATDPLWWVLFESPGYRDFVATLVGHEPRFASSQCVVKEALVGSRVAWHRDYPNSVSDYGQTPGVRLLLSIDHMTADNGATMVLPGSHLPGHPSWNYRPSHAAELFASEMRTLEARPGDVIALHPSIIHGGGINRSSGHRRVVTAHWLPADGHAIDRANFSGFGRTLETRHRIRIRRAHP